MEKEVKVKIVEEKSHDPSTPARGVATKSAGETRKPQQWLQHVLSFCEKCVFFSEKRQCLHEDFPNSYHGILYGKNCKHFIPR